MIGITIGEIEENANQSVGIGPRSNPDCSRNIRFVKRDYAPLRCANHIPDILCLSFNPGRNSHTDFSLDSPLSLSQSQGMTTQQIIHNFMNIDAHYDLLCVRVYGESGDAEDRANEGAEWVRMELK